jgi:hypothetical protein
VSDPSSAVALLRRVEANHVLSQTIFIITIFQLQCNFNLSEFKIYAKLGKGVGLSILSAFLSFLETGLWCKKRCKRRGDMGCALQRTFLLFPEMAIAVDFQEVDECQSSLKPGRAKLNE